MGFLEAVQNADLSGITGTINYSYDNAIPSLIYFLTGIVCVLLVIWAVGVIENLLCPHHKKYRELLTSMYVVGMIKKFSKEDDINLVEELKDYNKIVKKSRMRGRDLDKVIEQGLNEKISEKMEADLEKISEKERKSEAKK